MTKLAPAIVLGLLTATLAQSTAQAEVKKFVALCGPQKLCPFYRLALTPPTNWMVEPDASKKYRMQMMVPRGRTFGNADALLYVKVSVKQKDQEIPAFIAMSQGRWKQSVPDTKMTRIEDVPRKNGMPAFVSYRYENPSRPEQAFEAVSYAHDKDKDGNTFVLMVALTGAKKEAIDQAMDAYREFLRSH
jgi:hypothetical protein